VSCGQGEKKREEASTIVLALLLATISPPWGVNRSQLDGKHQQSTAASPSRINKGQTKDDDAYPSVDRAQPKRSTTKKGHKAPSSDNSTYDE
jgi:hypothetical protein